VNIHYDIENFCSLCRQKFPKDVRLCPGCHKQVRSSNFKTRRHNWNRAVGLQGGKLLKVTIEKEDH